jgi:hypothetical protein
MISKEKLMEFQLIFDTIPDKKEPFREFCEVYYSLLIRVKEISDKLPASIELPQPLIKR